MPVSPDNFVPFSANRTATHTFIYAPHPAERAYRAGTRRGGTGAFEISTGADLTLVENMDDANGRRTKELEARYNPRAVKDYEWLD